MQTHTEICSHWSGQISIIPKRELRTWGDILLLNHHFGVTLALGLAEVAIIYDNLPSPSNEGLFPQGSFKVQPATLEQKHVPDSPMSIASP